MTDIINLSLLPGMLAVVALGGLCAALLGFANRYFEDTSGIIVGEVNRLLPQTQCAQCGYPGCRPYAEAIVNGEEINRCPPGGPETISRLADLLGRVPIQLDESCGVATPPMVAFIREAECIGCTLCIQACPVDAILGASQLMHTVIRDLCTGCDLCRAPCPVDCIDLLPVHANDNSPATDTILTLVPDLACINCGDCAVACPKDLQPQLLYRFRKDTTKAVQFNLADCIECGRCDRVCPSELPLTNSFKATKNLVRSEQEKDIAAQVFETRYNNHLDRQGRTQKKIKPRPSKADRQSLLAAIRDDSGSSGPAA